MRRHMANEGIVESEPADDRADQRDREGKREDTRPIGAEQSPEKNREGKLSDRGNAPQDEGDRRSPHQFMQVLIRAAREIKPAIDDSAPHTRPPIAPVALILAIPMRRRATTRRVTAPLLNRGPRFQGLHLESPPLPLGNSVDSPAPALSDDPRPPLTNPAQLTKSNMLTNSIKLTISSCLYLIFFEPNQHNWCSQVALNVN
jgi:hypothetical protein